MKDFTEKNLRRREDGECFVPADAEPKVTPVSATSKQSDLLCMAKLINDAALLAHS